jgi:hypothetical protein
MMLPSVCRDVCVCSTVIMVNRCHVDLVVLERLVDLARRRFAMVSVGAGFWRVAGVFRRVMRLRVYMIRSPRIRAQAVDRLMALRRGRGVRNHGVSVELVSGAMIKWGLSRLISCIESQNFWRSLFFRLL